MENLRRYTLSVILSFLDETDGTSFMLTRRKYAYQLLPIFRLKNDGLNVQGSKNRHKFVICPVQDPNILLQRLNTRKLYKRKSRPQKGFTTEALAQREWIDQSPTYPPQLQMLRIRSKIDDGVFKQGITILASYPRSGNTLLRTLIERTSSLVTGSDTRPDRHLSRELAEQHNLVGEGIIQSNLTAFVKTHWPERKGHGCFDGRRIILIVRNPYDAIDSYWNMNATLSHTKTVTECVYQRFKDKFERLARNEIRIWMKFLNFWLEQSHLPILVVRFEDLIIDTPRELSRIVEFCIVGSISELWSNRIKQVTENSLDKMGSYRPRAGVGSQSIGKSLKRERYSQDLLKEMHEIAESQPVNYLRQLGYDIYSQNFPQNFLNGETPACFQDFSAVPETNTIRVNHGQTIRPSNCEFGRALQAWRHSVTSNDQHPLPTE